eukprot:scaffold81445_cov66-Phaeocystis_antarctica.AAC.7
MSTLPRPQLPSGTVWSSKIVAPKTSDHASSTASVSTLMENFPFRRSSGPLTLTTSPVRTGNASTTVWPSSALTFIMASIFVPFAERMPRKCSHLLKRCRWMTRSPPSSTA